MRNGIRTRNVCNFPCARVVSRMLVVSSRRMGTAVSCTTTWQQRLSMLSCRFWRVIHLRSPEESCNSKHECGRNTHKYLWVFYQMPQLVWFNQQGRRYVTKGRHLLLHSFLPHTFVPDQSCSGCSPTTNPASFWKRPLFSSWQDMSCEAACIQFTIIWISFALDGISGSACQAHTSRRCRVRSACMPFGALQTQTCVCPESKVSARTNNSCLTPPATYIYDPGPSLSQTTAKVNVHLLDARAVLHYVLEQNLKGKREERSYMCT